MMFPMLRWLAMVTWLIVVTAELCVSELNGHASIPHDRFVPTCTALRIASCRWAITCLLARSRDFTASVHDAFAPLSLG